MIVEIGTGTGVQVILSLRPSECPLGGLAKRVRIAAARKVKAATIKANR